MSKTKKIKRKEFVQFCVVGLGLGGREFHHFVEEDQDTISLVPDPTNEYDVNSIKIFIKEKHVGYVSAKDCVYVNLFLKRKNHLLSYYLVEKYSKSAKWVISDLTLGLKRKSKF